MRKGTDQTAGWDERAALTEPPPLADYAGRGPIRFRAMVGAVQPVAGTYVNIYTIEATTLKYELLYKYKCYGLTS